MKPALILIFLLVACIGDNELRPVDIHYGQDICERCKMIISEERFSSQLISSKGEVYNFDDIGGMILYLSENNINPEAVKIFVKDFNTKKWLTSDNAFYIRTENIKTPMNYEIIAVSDKNSADEIISKHGGKNLGKFGDAVKWMGSSKNK